MKDIKNKDQKVKTEKGVFPASVLTPVSHFLTAKLNTLEKRKKEISKEDPFANPSRDEDNASPDAEADEQFGHARTSALKKEISKSIIGIRKALTMIKLGKYGICEECGKMIDTERLMANPTATLCTEDAKKLEK
jgi:RNA polymerase-binding transcription factor DksA